MPRTALILTPRLPWPLDDGGRIASWQMVWAAAQAYDVTLLAGPVRHRVGAAPARARGARHSRRARPASAAGTGERRGGGLSDPGPTRSRATGTERSRPFSGSASEQAPAFVLAGPLHMATYEGDARGVPFVIRQHNVEHVWMERWARTLGATPAALYARVQAARLKRAEARLCRAAALTLAVHEEDAAALRALAPGARVGRPVAADLDRFPPPRPVVPPVVLLAGSFLWRPNVEGALRFLAGAGPACGAESPPRVFESRARGRRRRS